MHPPKQPDLVQRHLMTIQWDVLASKSYLAAHGTPTRPEELDDHALILFGDYRPPMADINWLSQVGRRAGQPRRAVLEVNSLHAMAMAASAGVGIAALPNWMRDEVEGLQPILTDLKPPKVDVFFVYPEELRNSKRVAVFRDFLLAEIQGLQ
jgi:DNA-binding transcriptional LysR family regulator